MPSLLTEHSPNLNISRTGTEPQAFSRWEPPTGTLGELVAGAYIRAALLPAGAPNEARGRGPGLCTLMRSGGVAVIAEIKRASPSKGEINPALDATTQALRYAAMGASAISVLTEPVRFGGSIEDLIKVSAAVKLPVIRKDFLVDPGQIGESAHAGASAILLIVRALAPSLLREMIQESSRQGLDALVEVRDELELDLALSAGAEFIGVNARNLETLEMDPSTHDRILPLVPRACLAVAESGISSRGDVERVARSGADAVLVGSSISAPTAGDLLVQLATVQRDRDARRN